MNSYSRNILKRIGMVPAALSIALSVPVHAQGEPPPAAVEITAARTEQVSPRQWVPGTVISRLDSRVAAQVPGSLEWVAEVGDRVEKGQPLARINDREMQLQLRNNTAEVNRLEAQLEYLNRQVARMEKLAKTSSTAESALDQQRSERDMLAQQLTSARVQVDRTRYDIARTQVAAPFTGVVAERMRQPGEYLRTGDEVVRLVSTESLEIRARTPLVAARYTAVGDKVELRNGKQRMQAKVSRIVEVGDERTRMMEMRVALEPGTWLIGEAVDVAVRNGPAMDALTVPRDALVLREGETFIFVIRPDNTARRVDVKTGDGAGDYIVIQGDLREGDAVVTRGAERLRDGRPVTIVRGSVAGRA